MSDEKSLFKKIFTKDIYCSKCSKKTYSEDFRNFFLLTKRDTNYPELTTLIKNLTCDFDTLIALSFFIRSPRGGRGHKKIFRHIIQIMFINDSEKVLNVLHKIPQYGRWDDIFYLFPNVLKLRKIEFVDKNYGIKVDKESLKKLQNDQKRVVSFMSNKFLYFFHLFMKGKSGFELFCKWLPSEKSAFNRKHKVVQTLCDELLISLKDYRVIYVSPMRQNANVLEQKMCSKDWGGIEYDKVSNRHINQFRRSFLQNDSERFVIWKGQHLKPYVNKPEMIIDNYFNEILKCNRGESTLLETQLQDTLKILLENNKPNNLYVIADTDGDMYKLYQNVRIISYVLSLLIIHSCYAERTSYKVFKDEFEDVALSYTLYRVVNKFRLMFTHPIKWHDLKLLSDFKENVLYITCHDIEIPEHIKLKNNLYIWNINKNIISYNKKNKLTYINGFSIEIYKYFLICGNYNLDNIITNIVNVFSK
jgi:hypothetical protein